MLRAGNCGYSLYSGPFSARGSTSPFPRRGPGDVSTGGIGAKRAARIGLTLRERQRRRERRTEGSTATQHDAEVRVAWMKAVPMRRYGCTEDIASAAAFLCSDEAGYITGAVLAVDGGFSGGRTIGENIVDLRRVGKAAALSRL